MDALKRLKSIIKVSLQEKSLDKLNEYLASLKNPKDLLSLELISLFTQILKKNAKYENKLLDVSCVVNCLQHFLNRVQDSKKWGKVSEDLSKLCNLVFTISWSYIKNEDLLKQAIAVISAIVDCEKCSPDDLLRFMMETLLQFSLSKNSTKEMRLDTMILIGSLLQKASRGLRTEIIPSNLKHLVDLSNTLTECDNYETQVSVVEILARSLIFVSETKQKSFFKSNPKVGEIYRNFHPFLNFDPDCRKFLNQVNACFGDQQKVFSVPCMVVSADDHRLKKPNGPGYDHFWVDLNLGSKSISFYYQPVSTDSWELMTVPEDKVSSAVAKDSQCQNRSGEAFAAVKIELILYSTEQSPNPELPGNIKIYPYKDKYVEVEHVFKNIFDGKYQTEVVYDKSHEQETQPNRKGDETAAEKSFIQTSTIMKVYENTNQAEKMHNESTSQVIGSSEEEADEEESVGDSPYLKFITNKMTDDKKTQLESSRSEEVKGVTGNSQINQESDSFEDKPKKSDNESKNEKCDRAYRKQSKESSPLSLQEARGSNISEDTEVLKTCKSKKRASAHELNNNSKKKRLYSVEKSNAEDVLMSSQDQVLSVQVPSYKLPKTEIIMKQKPNVNRKNVTHSYINNRDNRKSPASLKSEQLNQSNFEFGEENETVKLCDDDKSESSCESSPHALFKDLKEKGKPPSTVQSKKKNIFSNKRDKDNLQTGGCPKSAFTDFSSAERRDNKIRKTYERQKPKKPLKRLKAMPSSSSESSDCESEYVPPSKLLKENHNEPSNEKSPIKTRFTRQVVRDRVDPIRDNVHENDLQMEVSNIDHEPKLKPREIVPILPIPQEKLASQTKGKGPRKNKNPVKPKVTKPANDKNKRKPKSKEEIMEKLSQNVDGFLDIVNYEPPEAFDDLAFDILSCHDDQESALLLRTNFKVTDMVRFGKLLMEQVQKKIIDGATLAQKEREMNLATFDFNLQASCNELNGSCQKVETVTSRLEVMSTMMNTTYKLLKDVAPLISSQTLKIEDAKREFLTSANEVKKTESRSISSTFKMFGDYLKRLVLSFIQGSTTKNAISD